MTGDHSQSPGDGGLAALLARVAHYEQHGGDLETGRQLLLDLRDARQFGVLLDISEQVLRADPDDTMLRKHRAQALLDTGQQSLARDALMALVAEGDAHDAHIIDAWGLIGRAYKDLMLATAEADPALAARYATASISAYLDTFRAQPVGRTYQGINAAAVLHAAARFELAHGVDATAETVAGEVLEALEQEDQSKPWWIATRAEARLALGDLAGALADIATYIKHSDVTVFNLGSTWRQFTDVWDAHHDDSMGQAMVMLLESAYLERSKATSSGVGARIEVPAEHVREMRAGEKAGANLEAILGDEGVKSLRWYRSGLACAASVGLVTRNGDRPQGTCFVVDPADFGVQPEPGSDQLYALTNYHVVNREAEGRLAIAPHDAMVRFEAADDALANLDMQVLDVVAQSPVHEGLDYALITLDAQGRGPGPVRVTNIIKPRGEAARAYVIGYPRSAQSLSFSLHDSRILDHEGPDDGRPAHPDRIRVHYFSPTEPGSSGSPVFDEDWRCIALHHAGIEIDKDKGRFGIPKLNGINERYAANEGFWIKSVIDDVNKQLG